MNFYVLWVKYLSWFSYSYELLLLNQWDNVTHIECQSYKLNCFKNGNSVIDSYNVNKVGLFIFFFTTKIKRPKLIFILE